MVRNLPLRVLPLTFPGETGFQTELLSLASSPGNVPRPQQFAEALPPAVALPRVMQDTPFCVNFRLLVFQ